MEQLRSRLQETQQSLQSNTSELQQLQVEHDTLLERHSKGSCRRPSAKRLSCERGTSTRTLTCLS